MRFLLTKNLAYIDKNAGTLYNLLMSTLAESSQHQKQALNDEGEWLRAQRADYLRGIKAAESDIPKLPELYSLSRVIARTFDGVSMEVVAQARIDRAQIVEHLGQRVAGKLCNAYNMYALTDLMVDAHTIQRANTIGLSTRR